MKRIVAYQLLENQAHSDGRTLKLLHVVDGYTRKALAMRVARLIDADRTTPSARPDRPRARRPTRELVRMDNGPE